MGVPIHDLFPNGIKDYVTMSCIVTVRFPITDSGVPLVNCNQCRFHSASSNRCKLNDMICEIPDKYTGSYCPLESEENK